MKQKKPDLPEKARNAIRVKHYALNTERSYLPWIKRFIYFHKKKHPSSLGGREIGEFLTHLAVNRNVSANTQNQALNALVFLYRKVLKKEIGEISIVQRAKKHTRIPVVFTKTEAKQVIARLEGTKSLMAKILYGSGVRLKECLRLRVKDIDFSYNQIVVRDTKGAVDRVTLLPAMIKNELKSHLNRVKVLHEEDKEKGFGRVYLPFALERKYPDASALWAWQYVFPAARRSLDPRSGIERRHPRLKI